MAQGGCLCGAIRVKQTGEAELKAVCHCGDCKKISGSAFSTNVLVGPDGLQVTKGTPKVFSKTADSGSKIDSYFCGDCGSTLWRETESFGDKKIVKIGIMDSGFEDAKPVVELFASARPTWVQAVSGADQKAAMS